ncbi:MAG: hypothetical protein IJ003_06370 [Candidatus Gastranaerophilales bacterium]|nr:hypothetical protein [Candidatus Gastranaerophilales bacterium]
MQDIKKLEELTCEYYDNELNNSRLISFEADMANSESIREFSENLCFGYFKISNSMKLTKIRAKSKAGKALRKITFNRNNNLINRLLFRFLGVFR